MKRDAFTPHPEVEPENQLLGYYEAIEKASKLKPKDAMEKLDAEHAKAQLE